LLWGCFLGLFGAGFSAPPAPLKRLSEKGLRRFPC